MKLLYCLLTAAVIVVQALAPTSCSEARDFKKALPGYQLHFPADHSSHDDYKTEWWYYTGHLQSADGGKYGYELTFFRTAMDVPRPPKKSEWSVPNVYFAHFAISDVTGKKFFHTQRLTRPALGFSGAESKKLHVWVGDWSALLQPGGTYKLEAKTPEYSIDLDLTSAKPPVLHGKEGLSQKASCVGCASYYYSMTRMQTTGTLTKGRDNPVQVSGVTWMDHEFGSNQLTADQVGWDWFSVQLDDKTELMLYQMRRKGGKLDENSSGTFVLANGTTKHLLLADYTVTSTGSWTSPHTKGVYPMGWRVSIPSLHTQLQITPEMSDQELVKERSTDVTYWEGTCHVSGTRDGKPVTGAAYVEMTGYAEAFSKNI
jgi:predicted secreted hydrolase